MIGALLGLALALHPESFSTSRLVVSGATAELSLRCQLLSLTEVDPFLDADRDGQVSDDELAARRVEWADYLDRHWVLRAGGNADPRAGVPLVGRLVAAVLEPPDPLTGWPEPWVRFTVAYAHDAPIPSVSIHNTLFDDTGPMHSELCTLVWNDREPVETLFGPDARLRSYAPVAEPPPARGLLDWVALGWQHILAGPDHLAFVAALLVGARSLLALLGLVTAFTLAHSITLALAALGVVSLPGAAVEITIAASIAWVGLANLHALRDGGAIGADARPARRRLWPEAFGFGLVHGLGFAGFLAGVFAGEPARLVPLLGFNLGVEAGQLVALAALLLLGAFAMRVLRVPELPLRRALSASVAVAGLFWVVQRAGWA